MPDLTVSSDIDTFLAAADNAAARTALGLGNAATHAASDFDPVGAAAAAQSAVEAVIAALPAPPTADVGWTTNSDGGDKTKAIASESDINGLFSPFDSISFGSAAVLMAMASKIKALEAILALNKLPNT